MGGAGVVGSVRAGAWAAAALAAWFAAPGASAGAPLMVTAVSPAQHAGNAAPDTAIVIHFSEPIDPGTVTDSSVRVFGRWTGAATGTLALSNGDQTLTITPSKTFFAGDVVFVNLSTAVESAGGEPLRQGGWSHRFTVRAARAQMAFGVIGDENLIAPGDPAQGPGIYGGQASDLNGDGWADLSIICEFTNDVRLLLNDADGAGTFGDFLSLPRPAVGSTPSPNEPADFNNDGHADLVVSNLSSNSVSILLGNGDGTFGPAQHVTMGTLPRGVAVLDVNGDGAMDVATANRTSNNIAVTLNNGDGVFGAATTFEGGLEREYALSAADMNNDGLDDLIVGSREHSQVCVLLNDGDGTFTAGPVVAAGGGVWMLVPGDVNGDGFMDISTANGFSNSGTILYGDGAGSFGASQVMPAGNLVFATDLGDLDGDGDLDWVLSCNSTAEYRVHRNDGAGAMAFDSTLPGVTAPGCTIIVDIDNDGDLDMANLDEQAGTVTLRRNHGPLPQADINGDCVVNTADLGLLLAGFGGGAGPEDLNGDGVVNTADLGLMLGGFGQVCPN